MSRLSVEAIDVNCSDRREVFEEVMAEATSRAAMTVGVMINLMADAEATEALGREHRARRSASGDTKLPWACHGCGTTLARDFERNGHYPRGVQTTIGQLDNVQVPMLRCTECGAAADVEFSVLRKHKQLWLDVDAEAIFCYGQAGGTRRIAEQVGRQLGWPIGHSSVLRRVREVVSHVEDWQHEQIDDVPDVLMIDGIWFSVQMPTGERYTDSAGRSRPVTARVKRVAIVVLGLWSEEDRSQILDFQIADEETEDACVELLNRLHLRGVTEEHVELIASDGAGGICAAIETVYPTTARQRCVFHKLRNAADALCENAHQADLLHEAAWIYKADTKAEARERIEQFADRWKDDEPEAVETLWRDFEASVAYLSELDLTEPERYRTTNAMEGGVMRQLREAVDVARGFGSHVGAKAALFLTIQRLNANWTDRPWASLIARLLQQNPKANP
jgi:transposase-like protein